jgi:hypothetical protein
MRLPAQAVGAYEAARQAGASDRATLLRLGGAYADAGRCGDAELVLTDADRNLATPSDDAAGILARCQSR